MSITSAFVSSFVSYKQGKRALDVLARVFEEVRAAKETEGKDLSLPEEQEALADVMGAVEPALVTNVVDKFEELAALFALKNAINQLMEGIDLQRDNIELLKECSADDARIAEARSKALELLSQGAGLETDLMERTEILRSSVPDTPLAEMLEAIVAGQQSETAVEEEIDADTADAAAAAVAEQADGEAKET